MTMKRTVLTFVFDGERLLMILKKTGQGKGKWNVPGGKCAPGESDAAAAVRETREETGIEPLALEHVGTLEFHFDEGGSWANTSEVFISRSFRGELVHETEECSAHWISKVDIPWDKMWGSDRHWVPLVFAGKPFHRRYWFDAEDRLLREEIVDGSGPSTKNS